jgi:putative PEP-CTERM system TPR-repeat lipoprotein
VPALYVKALLLAQTNQMADALDVVRPAEAAIAKDLSGAMLLGVIHLGNNSLEAAYKYALQFHNLVPENIAGTKLLATINFRFGNYDKVISTLEPFREPLAQDAAALDLLGSSYMAEGRIKDANEVLTQAVSLRPELAATRVRLALTHTKQAETRDNGLDELANLVTRSPDNAALGVALITSYFRSGDYDHAIDAATTMTLNAPTNPLPFSLRGSAKQAKGDEAGARSDFGEALARETSFLPAALSLAELDMGSGDFDRARGELEQILKSKPTDLRVLMERAAIEGRANNLPAMISFLERAANANPTELEPRNVLLKVLASGVDPARAATMASDLAHAQAHDPRAVDLAIQTLLGLGKTEDALLLLKKMESDFSEDITVGQRVGQIYMRLGLWPAAATIFDHLLASNTTLLPVWAERISVEFKLNGLDAAMTLAAKAQRQNPTNELAKLLTGDLLIRAGRRTEAEAAYRKLLVQSPSPAVMARLFHAVVVNGDHTKADKIMADWLAAHPDDLGNRLTLADDFLAAKNYRAAAQQYETVAPKMPSNAGLFNNLASAYDALNDPRAVDTIKRAYRLSPGTPAIADTYGYLLYRKGNAEQGAALVRRAQQSEPRNPTIAYHLAEILSARDDSEGAKNLLRQLLDAKANFDDADAARKLYARLTGG